MPREASAQQLQFESPSPDLQQANVSSARRSRTKRRFHHAANTSAPAAAAQRKPTSAQLLLTPGALLTRSHLRELGLERRAIDAVFRALPVVELPGYSRPMVRADQYLEFVARHTYADDRVRPCRA